MAVQTLAYFKAKFITGYEITQADMVDWLDSFRHVSQSVPLSDTTGLTEILADYRAKVDKVPVADISGLVDYLNGILANYISTGSQLAIEQIEGLQALLDEKATLDQVQAYVDSLGLSSGDDGVDGVSITGVEINADKHLIITLSTGGPIDAGLLPSAEPGKPRVAYNWDIDGARDGTNKTYKVVSQKPWKAGTLKVFRQGDLKTPRGNDYVENDDRISVTFNEPVLDVENLVFVYEEE